MRIIHLACVAPPSIGGMGQAAYDEVVGLRGRGEEAVLVSSIEKSIKYQVSSIKYPNSSPYPIPDTRYPIPDPSIIRLPTWLRVGNASIPIGLGHLLKQADIIHLHYPWYGVAERLLWVRPRVPVVVTFHMDATANDWRRSIFDLHRRFIQPRLLQHASRIIVSSRDYAEHSSLRSRLDQLGDRVVELPFGLDTDFFSPPLDSRFPIPDSVLFVGGLDRAHDFKGLSVLLEAMRGLSSKTVVLDVIGDGDKRAFFERQAQDLGLSGRVHFHGRVDRNALREAYQKATVLAFPSTSSAEAFGLVALEAQACGLPVVASRLPGVRTLVRDQDTGFLVEPGSVADLTAALNRVLTDRSLRDTLALAARRHAVNHYSASHHIDRLQSIYREVCSYASPS